MILIIYDTNWVTRGKGNKSYTIVNIPPDNNSMINSPALYHYSLLLNSPLLPCSKSFIDPDSKYLQLYNIPATAHPHSYIHGGNKNKTNDELCLQSIISPLQQQWQCITNTRIQRFSTIHLQWTTHIVSNYTLW